MHFQCFPGPAMVAPVAATLWLCLDVTAEVVQARVTSITSRHVYLDTGFHSHSEVCAVCAAKIQPIPMSASVSSLNCQHETWSHDTCIALLLLCVIQAHDVTAAQQL
ncbi:hypothetical protein HaLaN_11888 [Haematococcus lacustris]|uniref:RING-type domain-containing protein n=1 Tax=Haematococcus lacustris TaxID=44745 RepID=A0A699YZA9_HAELA|nr:hypothetical protein HaLaN_11888 [Haematococcus lacustris]